MLLGPVFRAELIRTARRKRYFALRLVYGLILLLCVWESFNSGLARLAMMSQWRAVSIAETAAIGEEVFLTLAIVQLVGVVLVIPTLLGGAVADEKQRKTLHYLMASRLSSAQIVLDKLAARLLHVAVLVAMGVPVVCLLMLFGGVSWEYILVAYCGTATTAFFVAAVTVFVSTRARKVRQAVLITYLIVAFWFFAAPVGNLVFRFVFPQAYEWIEWAVTAVAATSPLDLFTNVLVTRRARVMPGPGTLLDPVLVMLGSQVALGTLLLLWSIVRLRPIYRLQEETPPRLNWFGSRPRQPRWLTRKPCANDAMAWKECHFTRTDVFTKLVILPATVIVTIVLIFAYGFDERLLWAIDDVWRHGRTAATSSLEALLASVQGMSAFYIGLWLMSAAASAAASVTVERERDTWTSLVSTPLSGFEILRGKFVGIVWNLRGFGVLMLLPWLLGLVLGAVHPLGLLTAALVLTLLTVLVVALGVLASLRASSTSKALMMTLGTLLGLNVGYRILLFSLPGPEWNMGIMPLVAARALLSWQGITQFAGQMGRRDPLSSTEVRCVLAALGVLACYTVAALGLVWRLLHGFDALLDRPHVVEEAKPPAPDQFRAPRRAELAAAEASGRP